MVGLSVTRHVNGLILSDPHAALAVAGGLVAVGAGLTLRQVFRTLNITESEVGRDGMAEVDWLDEQAPEGHWLKATTSVYSGLVSSAFTPAIKPRFRWLKGLWAVEHDINVGREVEPVELVDLTTVKTPTP